VARLSVAFVMDPVTKLDIDADTTFAFMLEAQRRGHRVHYADPAQLGVDEGRATARIQRAELRRERGRHVELAAPRQVVLDDECDVVFQRRDPPVDADYVTATQILALCRRALVLNRPSGILAANEKLYACHFPDLMAETRVTREMSELVDFMTKLGGEMVVKPLSGRGGEGVFHLRHDDRNLFSILEQSTAFGTRWVMAQRYLPEVRRGDKRILLLEGEPLGALLRVPAERETRANLHVGGRPERAVLDGDDLRIVERLRPWLQRDGLFFVGIDVIGGRLTEVNVTSPTGIQEMGRLDGEAYEARVIERVERLLAEGGTR
jgi:glutathione synthase